ncbi:MAG: IPT/TIG domain-containing protein [Acidobacteria bacterium]|nr:IPT/TIG domain-containing protein [Acidobacteriota bacterium]
MTRRIRLGFLAVVLLIAAFAGQVQAQSAITYVYDKLGRLIGVVDPAGDTAVYTYDAVGNILSISRYSSSQLSIISFTPDSGPVGAQVTIYGTGFSSTPANNTVKFNGVTATVTSSSLSTIQTTVPSGATTGPISVTVSSVTVTSSASFTVGSSSAPTITGFTPTVGAPGTAVTITGSNFQTTPSKNQARFNIAAATISSSTSSSIETTVPPTGTSGRISVTTPAGKGTSTGDFFVPPSPYTAGDVGYTGRMALDESEVVTLSTANKIGLVVFDATQYQRASLRLTSTSTSGATIPVFNPGGTTLATATIGVGTTGGFLDTTILPTTGTYTIMVDPSGTGSG